MDKQQTVNLFYYLFLYKYNNIILEKRIREILMKTYRRSIKKRILSSFCLWSVLSRVIYSAFIYLLYIEIRDIQSNCILPHTRHTNTKKYISQLKCIGENKKRECNERECCCARMRLAKFVVELFLHTAERKQSNIKQSIYISINVCIL